MNKNIRLSISSIIFFILNIIILLSSIFLRKIYIDMGYNVRVINVFFIINIVILLLCVAFNFYLLKNEDFLLKKVIILAVFVIIIYGIINLGLVSFLNKKNNADYYQMTAKLINYCKDYSCNKFETVNLKNKRKFSLEKKYTDYNNETQLIKIDIIYDKVNIKEINSTVYSSNESYSPYLIKEQLILYLSKFNVELNEENINKAFDKRDIDKVMLKKQTYEVKSVYNNKKLEGFKTMIKISLKDN